MDASAWKPMGAVDAGSLAEARRQAHNAAQWLVRVAHSFMPPSSDNRHALLRWDPERAALITQEFLPGLALELRLPGLAMQFREGDQPAPHVFEFDGRTPAEAEAWVLVELLHRRLDRDRFSKALPYAFPGLMTGDAIPYVAEPLAAALDALAVWFSNSTIVLRCTAKEFLATGFHASGAVCWPEFFELGVLLPLEDARPGFRQILRAGSSAGNERQTTPHFYVKPHESEASQRGLHGSLPAAVLAASADPMKYALDWLHAEISRYRLAS